MVFKLGVVSSTWRLGHLSPGAPETRRGFFLSASASADVLFNGPFVVQKFGSNQGQCCSTRSWSSSVTNVVSISAPSTKRRMRASSCGERSS